jgi:hypothetical protein
MVDSARTEGTVTIRAYRQGDEQGILAGYNRVFPTADGRIPVRSPAHWQWKFLQNPTGLVHIAVAEHEEHGIVGNYVTMPLRLWVEGQEAICGQVIDLYVLPEWRRHGQRPGLFVNIALKHYELFGGAGPGQNLFHYGWPVPNWRIGKKYLAYENVRDWDFLFREIGGGSSERPAPGGLVVREVARFGADVDALWDAQKRSMTMALVRDARYLNWRYADAHDGSYVLCECREQQSGALRGICVYTVCDFLFPRTAFLVDWLCPLDDRDATIAMVAAAERRAATDRANALAVLFPQLDPRFLAFQRLGFLVYGTSYFLVVAPFVDRGTLFYREQWYHTCGDSDLV